MSAIPEGWCLLEGNPNPPPPVDRETLRAAWACQQGSLMPPVRRTAKITPVQQDPWARVRAKFPKYFTALKDAEQIVTSAERDLTRRKRVIKVGGDLPACRSQLRQWKKETSEQAGRNDLLAGFVSEISHIDTEGGTLASLKAHAEIAQGAIERASDYLEEYGRQLKEKSR